MSGNTRIEAFLPLKPAALDIMAALANDDLHGYAILQRISAWSTGRRSPSPASVYRQLGLLLGHGLVIGVAAPEAESAHDQRRRFYRLTETGSQVLHAELDRLERVRAVVGTTFERFA